MAIVSYPSAAFSRASAAIAIVGTISVGHSRVNFGGRIKMNYGIAG